MTKLKSRISAIAAAGALVLAYGSAFAETMYAPQLNADMLIIGSEKPDLPVPTLAMAGEKSETDELAGSPIDNLDVVVRQEPSAGGRDGEAVIYRGGKLDSEETFAFLRGLGVGAVANLQNIHPSNQRLCGKYGLNCGDFGIAPFGVKSLTDSRSNFQGAFRFVNRQRKAGRKVYIHCLLGNDRTGALAAALILRDQACGKTFDKARLISVLDNSLRKHNFGFRFFSMWHSEIKDWVENFDKHRPWLCE
ncbi:MAG: hypothetical protein PHV36_14445 [Elusimicrobiales bacterium]|nr:hypothetical protein [Elusimicrobiales bacterium]